MSILMVIIGLTLLGFVLYLVNTYVPMPAPYKTALMVIIILMVIIWFAQNLGIANFRIN